MRFGYVILGLVTLAFLHVSSGEHPCEMFLDTPTTLAQLQNPWGRGGSTPIAVEAQCYGEDFFLGPIGR